MNANFVSVFGMGFASQLYRQKTDAAATLKCGEILKIHSASELANKLTAAQITRRLAIIYFTATWCGPCRQISPFYTSLAQKYPRTVFLKVDIDEASDAATNYNISSVPTFIFVKDDKEVDKFIGVDKNGLESMIKQHAY